MAEIALQDVRKSFGRTVALDGVTFDVDDGEFFCLLGPSGAGKTTTLKVIAGLEPQDAGSVALGGNDVTDVEPTARELAMCFESYALYPQLNVFDNMASPLRSPKYKVSESEADTLVREAAEMLGIDHLLDRNIGKLSNGQRQRVALGRVLVRPATARLLDEPLAHLDAKLRATMRGELKSISAHGSTTTVYVTHDYVEALALADRIGVLREGRILQVGTPRQLWDEPANAFVATAFGKPRMSLVQGRVAEGGEFASDDGAVRVPLSGVEKAVGDQVQLGVRPRDLALGGGEGTSLSGVVYVVEYLGRQAEVTVRVGKEILSVLVPRTAAEGLRLDDQVALTVDPARVHVFEPGEEGKRL